jgi:hypothetical protein
MSLYKTVYDPKGEPFEVGPETAAQLVLNKGWTQTPPEAEPAKPAAPVAPPKPTVAPAPVEPAPVVLDSKTKGS